MTLPEAAGVLHLPMESVVALVGAGYLRTTSSDDGPRFALGDLKAFLARNADGEPVVDLADVSLDSLDPQDLLDALDGRSEDMARRALDLLIAVFPEAGRWPLGQQARFIDEARSRFEAILAVASLGDDTDAELLEELAANGVKHDPEKAVLIGKDGDGKIVFLESGNVKAGLQHVMDHADQFADVGVPREKVGQFVFDAATTGKIVGYQGKGTGRPIYEFMFEGKPFKVAVTVGSNGFIVGANPVGH